MNNLSVTHARHSGKQAARSRAADSPTRPPFQFVYVGDAALARECFAGSRSIDVIAAVPGPNKTLDRLPTDIRTGGPLVPDVLFIEHGYPGVDAHAILKDIAARHLHVLVVIVAEWDDEVAGRSFSQGADDYVVKSKASFRAVAFRMGRLLAHSAHLRAHHVAGADTAAVDALEREVTAAKLAWQGAELHHASEMSDATARLAAVRAAADALERTLSDTVAAVARAEERAAADRQAAAEAALHRQTEFDRRLAAEVAEREQRTKELAGAVAALQRAGQQHATEKAEAAAQLVATVRRTEAQAARAAMMMSALQRTLDDTASRLTGAERQAAEDRQAIDEAARRQATFETEMTEEVARRQALAKQLSDAESALAQAEQRRHSETAAAAVRLADQQQHASAAVEALETQLRGAETSLQRAEQRRSSEMAQVAAQLAAAKREGESQAAETAAAMSALRRTLDDTAATLARVEQQAAEDRQAAIDAAGQRQATFETEMTEEVARRQALAKQLSDAESAARRRQAEFDTQLAAAVRRTEVQAVRAAAVMSALQRTLDDTAAALSRVEHQAAGDRQAAMDAMAQRQATFETELGQEVARREVLAKQLADAKSAAVALEMTLRDTRAALIHAEELAAADRQTAAAAALQRQAEFDTQLAAAKTQAETQAAEAAAAMRAVQCTLDDTMSTLARVEQQASENRQAAIDAAMQQQAEFDKRLAAEVAERQRVAQQLAGTVATLQRAEQQHAVEKAEAASRLAATLKDAESQLARAAADAAAALDEAEQRAAADRQIAADAAVQCQAEFDKQLASEVAERELRARQLAGAIAALQQTGQQHASEVAEAAAQLAAAKTQAETQAAEAAAAMRAVQCTLDDTTSTLARVEQQASENRQAAIDAAIQQRAEFDKQLAAEVAERQRVAQQLAGTVATLQRAEQQHAAEKAEAAARLAATLKDAESQLARAAADAAAALDEAEQRAAADRQIAADAAVQRQAEFDKQLASEVAERELRARQLAGAVAALQQTGQQHASEVAEAAAQLAAAKTQAGTQAAEAAAAMSAVQRTLDDTIATLTRVERQAAEDRRAAIDDAARRQAGFDKLLAAAKREADAELARSAADAVAARRQADALAVMERRRFEHAPASICRCTPDGTMSQVNHAFARFLGYETPDELRQIDLASDVFESADELRWIVERCLASSSPESIETTWTRKGGSRIIVRVRAVATTSDSIEMTAEDITTQRVLEEKLRLSQRMEAVARFASEVAVTCDNLLRHVEQEGRRWLVGSGSDEARYHGGLLLEEVTRAAKYLNQLTVYGNEQKGVPELVDLNKVLRDLEPVLKRVAGNDIDLVLPKASSSLNLDVDAERVERMLVNVAAYGRARMPLGGRLMFQVAPTQVDRTFAAKYPNVRPGAHVLLTVNETRGAVRPDLAAAGRSQRAEAGASESDSPGVDLTTLQGLVSGCGGHLWMMAEPQGDMVLRIHLPRRALDRPDPRARLKPRARTGWLKRAAGLQN